MNLDSAPRSHTASVAAARVVLAGRPNDAQSDVQLGPGAWLL
jgi:hypothetical protein